MLKKLLNTKLKVAKNQKGLTLIELLVVIVILGIIAAIAIPAIMGNRASAAYSTNNQNLSILRDAVKRYQTVNGEPPADLDTLITSANGGPYIETIPDVEAVDGCGDEEFTYNNGSVTVASGCLGETGGE